MFERFTERARNVVVLAKEKSRDLRHNYIGAEHLLYGLAADEEGLAARVLASLDVTPTRIENSIRRIVGVGDEDVDEIPVGGQIPFTPRAKHVLERSFREALSLGHNYIGTEHVLLALTREDSGIHARMFEEFGALHENISDRVIELLSGPREKASTRTFTVDRPGTLLRFQGQLVEVVGIGEGKTIHMREVGARPCSQCGRAPEHAALEHAPLFQDNAEPVETLRDL